MLARFREFAIAVLALGGAATATLAGGSVHKTQDYQAEHGGRYRHSKALHGRQLAPRQWRDRLGAHPGPTYSRIAPAARFGPGYIFVPGRGILGEDCNMPTSTCPNEYRDVW